MRSILNSFVGVNEMREKSAYDFDSDYDYYDYLDSLHSSDDDREPDDDEPCDEYEDWTDKNYMSNDARFID